MPVGSVVNKRLTENHYKTKTTLLIYI